MKYPNLFSPIKINKMMVKNRIVATPAGAFDDKSKGGAGIIIAGSMCVEPGKSSWFGADERWAFHKYEVEKTRERVLIAKQAGAKASLELGHAGQYARVNDYAIGPTGFIRDDGINVVEMTEEMMEETVKWYAKSAVNAKELGFDMIFMHFAHGWLAAEFLSPLFNKRTDEFGGSFENRSKFPKMILEGVREAVGPDYPIDMRIGAYEWVEGSIEFEDVLAFIKLVEPLIDSVQISAGLDINHEGNVHMATTNFEEHMPNVHWAEQVKKEVNIPVAVVGAIMNPDEAEELISSGKVDLVAIGRAFIADSEWPKKALEGRSEDIVPCLRCLQCYHIASNRRNVGCSVNPRYKNENRIPLKIERSSKKKRVVIIGGGPAGMKAALTAEQRGHEVVLYEKEAELGGAIKTSGFESFKIDLKAYLKYLKNQIAKSEIKVLLNTEATPECVRSEKPDSIIIAVGASPIIPSIKGNNLPHVIQGIDAIYNNEKIGKSVVIIGGGSIGCELGLELSLIKGKAVSIVEIAPELALNGNMLYRIALRQKMDMAKTLSKFTGTTCKEITEDGVIISGEDGVNKKIQADTVIISVGLKPDREIAEAFYGITPETVMIGDCDKPRKVMEATTEGFSVAYNL